MTEKPAPSSMFKSFLIWFSIFYLLFWGYNSFILGDTADKPVKQASDLELVATPSHKFVLGRPASFSLKNNTAVAWDYANPCADGRRLQIARVLNQTELKLDYTQSDCEANITSDERIVVPAGSSYSLGLGAINGQLFTEEGSYRAFLPPEVTGLETTLSADFTYKAPGFFRKGFRGLISQPLFNLLAFLVDKIPTHSLGWAIVGMTLLVRMILIIPNQKAMRSQRKLQKLQPEMQSLKKKHGKDQQAVAMATMALYKKHKINPMSSCLPILLQMPFLLGIYFVVRDGLHPEFQNLLYKFQSHLDLSTVDNAFFGLDLSVPNIWVLPVIVGLAQFVAMRLAIPSTPKEDAAAITKKKSKKAKPSEPDMAAQMQQMQKMMVWMMPIMIGFFTATFPAGVGIYWLTSTVFGIGQQKFVNWQLDRPKVKRRES